MNAIAQINESLLEETYEGTCCCCGEKSTITREHRSIREGYSCRECGSSLRYRGQAELLIQLYGDSNTSSLSELVNNSNLSSLSIYEPGVSGPFRQYFDSIPGYQNSFFWPDVDSGEMRDGVRCENLESLTFDSNSIDLIVSSDIMEHVRRPMEAFKEIHRVLRPGGRHVFSIPVQIPMRAKSHFRVDTTTSEDLYIDEAHYHGDGIGGRSLVYVDYGADLIENLLRIGYIVTVHRPSDNSVEAQRLITFASTKL